MKKLVAIMLVWAVLLPLVGCTGGDAWKALLEEGQQYLEEEKPKKAIAALEEALAQAPKGERLWVYLALIEAHEQREDMDSIQRILEQAREEGFENWRLDRHWEQLEEYLNAQKPEEPKDDLPTGDGGEDGPGSEEANTDSGEVSDGPAPDAVQLYTIERKDYSLYSNEEKTIGIELYFDLLQFHPSLERFRQANQILQSMADNYAAHCAEYKTDEMISQVERQKYIVTYAYDATVPYQDSRYICVRYQIIWWMGGSYTADYDTLVFSMETGQLLTLADLLAKEDNPHGKVCDAVKAVTAEFGDPWAQTIADTVSARELTDFEFFLDEDGQIVVYFDTYDIAPGAAGRVEAPMGIYVK